MVTKSLEKELLNAVEIINKKLLDKALKDENGTYWETMGLGSESTIVWEAGESIYGGTAGIALYFLRQYKVLGNELHLKVAKEAIEWTRYRLATQQGTPNAFLTGSMGVGLVMLELEHLQPDKKMRAEAIKIIAEAGGLKNSDWEIFDYINGSAGRIHGLLHAHQLTQDASLLSIIDKLAEDLLQNSWLTEKGLYWDRSGQQVCGLCGLSHGAGGIGYVFLELARYFNNPALNMIARQALSYEDGYYDKEKGNWPDLRRGSYTPADLQLNKDEYNKGNIEYFERRNDMNAWCHGAAGIGLVRLEAYKQLGDRKYLRDAKAAIKKTISTDIDREDPKVTYTLCHGAGGNAEIFIRAYEVLQDKKQWSLAQQVAKGGVEFYKNEGYYASGYAQGATAEDVSLFMGIAGVGYFYLRTLYPEKFPSLLAPSLNGEIYGKAPTGAEFLNLDEAGLQKVILSGYFKETLAALGNKKVFSNGVQHIYKSFKTALKDELKTSSNKNLKKAFKRESKAFEFDLKAPSHALLAIKNIVQSEKVQHPVAYDRSYILDRDVMLLPTADDHLLIGRNSKGLQEDSIPMFTYQVLKAFSKGERAGEVLKKVSSLFGELSPEEQQEVDQAVKAQINEAFNSGKIVEFEN